ncbi:Rieske domain-containing protein [Pyricularia oryzae 70-15]|uniref:Rieske domain-containing protein n=3 Tax=Pyricularia oryzae TaxID=318829 RepID=G5EHY6_PYRO7|nr:Rieske domain-containing protein [Pyricularia oryzae 70-15]ELQ33342.1 rieske domain-containing protein [Pyricularia oryzae Y34]KAI7920193.1 Rieske domain-containing protein [Pyricularia oryzae]EAQ70774.1 hypothetical protein MGCH7_ch7g181 [Pyricularia oryzae 70-15]EHA46579.1 Rieske domain-containing protein [Pyricularia oryzae 70-15]KAI7920977.1 Rieske domain-containing protein [Pyricularia oryzae]
MFDGLARAIQAYRPGRPDSGWFFAGLASSFPNIDNSHDGALAEKDIPAPCEAAVGSTTASIPACKVFRVPLPEGPRGNAEAEVVPLTEAAEEGADLRNQVLVFQYRGKFHAVDHQCPHSSFPLSRGSPFDIEDFGVVLSTGIACPKHGWSFDLFSGQGDRGSYRLKIWEVELRDASNGEESAQEKEVWVRRKQRIG